MYGILCQLRCGIAAALCIMVIGIPVIILKAAARHLFYDGVIIAIMIELTVAAAKECVTNCIKHADGNEVYIRIAQRGERYDVTITNNGKIPTEPIKEGSGPSTLRCSIESSGGEMHISHNPRFALLITIPAKESSL